MNEAEGGPGDRVAAAPDGIAVNCFRIDVAVASEGFVANAPSADHRWSREVAARHPLDDRPRAVSVR